MRGGLLRSEKRPFYLGVSVSQVRRHMPRKLITRLPGLRHVIMTRPECDWFLREQTDIAKLAA